MPGQRKRDLDDAEIVLVCCCVGGVGMAGFVRYRIELCGDEESSNGRRE